MSKRASHRKTAEAILFACTMNSIRSPMAEALARAMLGEGVKIDSVGVFAGPLDPFVDAILAEQGLILGKREAKDLSQVDLTRYDVIIVLTPQAEQAIREKGVERADERVEIWDIPNPTDIQGSRELMMDAYRETLKALESHIQARFGSPPPGNQS